MASSLMIFSQIAKVNRCVFPSDTNEEVGKRWWVDAFAAAV